MNDPLTIAQEALEEVKKLRQELDSQAYLLEEQARDIDNLDDRLWRVEDNR